MILTTHLYADTGCMNISLGMDFYRQISLVYMGGLYPYQLDVS